MRQPRRATTSGPMALCLLLLVCTDSVAAVGLGRTRLGQFPARTATPPMPAHKQPHAIVLPFATQPPLRATLPVLTAPPATEPARQRQRAEVDEVTARSVAAGRAIPSLVEIGTVLSTQMRFDSSMDRTTVGLCGITLTMFFGYLFPFVKYKEWRDDPQCAEPASEGQRNGVEMAGDGMCECIIGFTDDEMLTDCRNVGSAAVPATPPTPGSAAADEASKGKEPTGKIDSKTSKTENVFEKGKESGKANDNAVHCMDEDADITEAPCEKRQCEADAGLCILDEKDLTKEKCTCATCSLDNGPGEGQCPIEPTLCAPDDMGRPRTCILAKQISEDTGDEEPVCACLTAEEKRANLDHAGAGESNAPPACLRISMQQLKWARRRAGINIATVTWIISIIFLVVALTLAGASTTDGLDTTAMWLAWLSFALAALGVLKMITYIKDKDKPLTECPPGFLQTQDFQDPEKDEKEAADKKKDEADAAKTGGKKKKVEAD